MFPELAVKGSVGAGGKNLRTDVRVVQLLLNAWAGRAGRPLLAIDGVAGPLTCDAISSCQRALGMPVVDGRVDPGGPTLKALGMLCVEDLKRGIRPAAMRTRAFDGGSAPLPAPDLLKLLWTALAGTHHMSD